MYGEIRTFLSSWREKAHISGAVGFVPVSKYHTIKTGQNHNPNLQASPEVFKRTDSTTELSWFWAHSSLWPFCLMNSHIPYCVTQLLTDPGQPPISPLLPPSWGGQPLTEQPKVSSVIWRPRTQPSTLGRMMNTGSHTRPLLPGHHPTLHW